MIMSATSLLASAQTGTYVGSTPAHRVVRAFLGISAHDSIDFIKWKLVMEKNGYELSCQYGLGKAGTDGFTNPQQVQVKGIVKAHKTVYTLHQGAAMLNLLVVNDNLLHLLDEAQHMLVGNGGFSYVLNNTNPVPSAVFTIAASPNRQPYPLEFDGRTPCAELSKLHKLNRGPDCNKLKWYFRLYLDSVTGKPVFFMKGSIAYNNEALARGSWQVKTLPNGRIMYELTPFNKAFTLQLLKGDENILFFVRPDGSLPVGNKDFSYTLNRRQ